MVAASFRDYVERVREVADILEIVGEAVTLRKAGRAHVGLCPFHQEKTPSFSVDGQKGVYYCFGCHRGGDVFRFVQELHQVDFRDAVRWLGDRYQIPRPTRTSGPGDREGERRERLLAAMDAAQAFFRARLAGPDAALARDLLQRRGLLDQAERFGIGFAPASWDALLRHLTSRGWSVEEITAAGLVVRRNAGGGVYDRFRNRITFPIRGSSGRIVSFGGRIAGEGEPKYLNGPESPVYDKGRTLFRLSETAAEIRSSGRAVLVEGYFDALSLAAAGMAGVVALCGTSLSDGHVQLLRRWTRRVVLLLDADEAGRRAAGRALPPLLAAGLAVRVAFPPEGLDPDDFVRERGLEAAEALVEHAAELPEFLFDRARRSHDLASLDGRLAAFEEILDTISFMPSAMARVEVAEAVADAMRLDERAVREELAKAARRRRRKLAGEAALARAPRAPFTESERLLLRYLIESARSPEGPRVELVEGVPMEALGPEARAVLTEWRRLSASGQRCRLAELSEAVPDQAREALLELAFAPGAAPDEAQVEGVIEQLRERQAKERLADLQRQIEREADAAQVGRLMREKLELARRIAAGGSIGGGADAQGSPR